MSTDGNDHLDEVRRLYKEIDEQCRINGMGAQRELKLKTQLREATDIITIMADRADRLKSELGQAYPGYMSNAVVFARAMLTRWGKV